MDAITVNNKTFKLLQSSDIVCLIIHIYTNREIVTSTITSTREQFYELTLRFASKSLFKQLTGHILSHSDHPMNKHEQTTNMNKQT